MRATVSWLLLAGVAPVPNHVAARCVGSETVTVAEQPPRTIPDTLTFSADLSRGRYCYDRCLGEQTFAISAVAPDRLVLADTQAASSQRQLSYDRVAGTVRDEQNLRLGPIRVVRHAQARCVATTYRQPPVPAP